MCFVRFRTTEQSTAARSWLISHEKTLRDGYPPFTVADIGFTGLSFDDTPSLRRDSQPTEALHISGLGCRINNAMLGKLLQPFDGVKNIILREFWYTHSLYQDQSSNFPE